MSDYSYYLDWDASTDALSGVKEYTVYRDDVEIGKTTQLSYYVGDTMPDGHCYTVTAVDYSNNVSTKPTCVSYASTTTVQWYLYTKSSSGFSEMYINIDGNLAHYEAVNGVDSVSGTIEAPIGSTVDVALSQNGNTACNIDAYWDSGYLGGDYGLGSAETSWVQPAGTVTVDCATS